VSEPETQRKQIEVIDVTNMSDREINKMLKERFGNNFVRVLLGDYYLSKGLSWVNANITYMDREECEKNGYFYYDIECFDVPAKDVLLLLKTVNNTEDERTYFTYEAVLRTKDVTLFGVKVEEKGDKKVFTKKYEDGEIEIETNKDELVTRMKARTDGIEIEAHLKDGSDVLTITKYYGDGTTESLSYTFSPGNPNYEDPWCVYDLWYYNDYLKEKSIMPLIKDLLDCVKYFAGTLIKDEEEEEDEY
jgi:hypothetical protein